MPTIKIKTVNTFLEGMEAFKMHCKTRNLSPDTIRSYECNAQSFLQFMGGNDFDINLITKRLTDDFIAFCQKKNNRSTTINTKIKHLRAIFNHFAEHGWMEPIKLKLLKEGEVIKEVYTDAELEKLLKKPNLKSCGFDDLRNWALTNYFISTGNRVSSVINIKMTDVDLQNNEIILRHTKNKRQQIVPICSALKIVMMEYIKYRQPKSDNDFLFCSWHGEQLTKYGLRNALVRYNQRRGVQRSNLHAYRHTFSKHWILNGGDVFRLQKLLGHSSLEMTRKYVNMFDADLKANIDDFNPLSKLASKNRNHIKL